MLISFGSSACSDSVSENITQTETAQIIKRVDKSEFNSFLAEHPTTNLIDVRTPAEYAAGTIGNAKNIDFNASSFKTDIDKLDKTEPVLIFCMSGARSSRALEIMRDLGFEHVLELAGGYRNY